MIHDDAEEGLNTAVYNELRTRLVTGRMSPGHELSTRSIAAELGVSQTPVRDALSRLAAEGAVAIRSKRRIRVPAMTAERFDDLLRCRLLLEPEAAALALPHLEAAHMRALREIDAKLDAAILSGDADAYMQCNHAFHFTLYRAQNRRTLLQLIETLWLQFGPFMRLVYGRVANAPLNDNHQAAIAAIQARDADALRAAIAADIGDGMGLISRTGLVSEDGLAPNA
ncbi:MAG TPA: GntR family transcriptional regulator [Vitreimonas sp.]|uniref:GntR family transcriptional regulator n=1 Tax=Vitreimonas sp. TaxID=3069702 RepID=UPI002D34B2D4|nr:GntR family transcriptional regulator [Vitreimonas sp.]HYD89819.1 GntR family transcriptional regulator [Vitreimonas sp.]